MIVLSFGVRKSGSTLAFEMAKAVLECNGYPQVRLPDGIVQENRSVNTVGRLTDDRLERLIEAAEGMAIAVKTHRPPDLLTTGVLFRFLESGQLRINVVYRDPRDTVLSILDHGARSRAKGGGPLSQIVDLKGAIELLAKDVVKLRRWGMFPSLKLPYEAFAVDRVWGPESIAADLGMRSDPDEVWRLIETRDTKRNVARPHRHRDEFSTDDIARVEAALPEYLDLVVRRDPTWFQRLPGTTNA